MDNDGITSLDRRIFGALLVLLAYGALVYVALMMGQICGNQAVALAPYTAREALFEAAYDMLWAFAGLSVLVVFGAIAYFAIARDAEPLGFFLGTLIVLMFFVVIVGIITFLSAYYFHSSGFTVDETQFNYGPWTRYFIYALGVGYFGYLSVLLVNYFLGLARSLHSMSKILYALYGAGLIIIASFGFAFITKEFFVGDPAAKRHTLDNGSSEKAWPWLELYSLPIWNVPPSPRFLSIEEKRYALLQESYQKLFPSLIPEWAYARSHRDSFIWDGPGTKPITVGSLFWYYTDEALQVEFGYTPKEHGIKFAQIERNKRYEILSWVVIAFDTLVLLIFWPMVFSLGRSTFLSIRNLWSA